VGKIQKPDLQDIKYIEQVLKLIKKQNIPAPAPIEQRWTASSKSPLSPASSSSTSSDALYSWVCFFSSISLSVLVWKAL
jgi:L-galactono-1,4-lactone dehydrogenase